jgi:hypothetical protein
MLRAIIPVLVATLLAAGLGVGATRLPGAPAPAGATAKTDDGHATSDDGHAKPGDKHAKADDKKADDKHAKPEKGKEGPPTVSGPLALPPIVGPLRAPDQFWVRFEGVVVVDEMDAARSKALLAEIADDTLIYFSTLSLVEIEGAAGLKAVREDLVERARIRGDGKVRDLLIQALVTQ